MTPAKSTWRGFAHAGNEWIVAYACLPGMATGPLMFSIGHAVELYLKAAHLKIYGDLRKTKSMGHKLIDIWDSCKQRDSHFMPDFEILRKIAEVQIQKQGPFLETLSPSETENYFKNQQLYIVFTHLMDLKYLHALWVTKQPDILMTETHGAVWVRFFRDMRLYLDFSKEPAEFIKLEWDRVPTAARRYLNEIYEFD